MYESGVPVREIADKEGLSRHAIYGVIRRYRHQQSAKDIPHPGRPQLLSERDKSHIKTLIRKDTFISYKEIINRAYLTYLRSTVHR
jgi:transposase